MANRDPSLFPEPNTIDMERKGNRHSSFGLGVHRCIGSNVARTVFKRMLVAVFDRMPDYVCDPEGSVHYDSIGVIQGCGTCRPPSPRPRTHKSLADTLVELQEMVVNERLAEPLSISRKREADGE